MYASLFKHLLIRQQRIFRLFTIIDGVNNIRDTGTVKRFSKDKGFGCIKRHSNGNMDVPRGRIAPLSP
jgi:hypothetical protein